MKLMTWGLIIRAVSGTCRNLGQKMQLEGRGFDVYVFDANDPV